MTTTVQEETDLPTIRPATRADQPAIERLLADSGLPVAGVDRLLEGRPGDFLVASTAGSEEIVGVAGLEVCCDNALLRSVAVRPAWRAHGLGHELVRRVVCEAEGRGVQALYLLTMTAEHYFPRFGFERVERESVPADIAETQEFTTACPATAVVMARQVQQTVA